LQAGDFNDMKRVIKDEMPQWLENLRQFDNVDWDDFA